MKPNSGENVISGKLVGFRLAVEKCGSDELTFLKVTGVWQPIEDEKPSPLQNTVVFRAPVEDALDLAANIIFTAQKIGLPTPTGISIQV